MPCFSPLPAWRTPGGDIVLSRVSRESNRLFSGGNDLCLPCGSCLGCRAARSREWAYRCSLELARHEVASWCTLTYDDAHLPPTLSRGHLSGFIKRVRARIAPAGIRFFATGEYGERTFRPHYHAILFGMRDASCVQACWKFGFSRVDDLTQAAIAYVAGYCSKKLGSPAELREDRVDFKTGEIYKFQPPFLQMSRRPGIGGEARLFWRSWRSVGVFNGSVVPVPRFLHESWVANVSDVEVEALRLERVAFARVHTATERELVAGAAIVASKSALTSSKRFL